MHSLVKKCVYIKQLDYELKISVVWEKTRVQPESTINHRIREQIINN